MDKNRLLDALRDSGIIAVIRQVPETHVLALAESLLQGGVRCLEITVDFPGAFSALQKVATTFGEKALVGAGTVLDEASARLAIESGAQFLFSPSLHPAVIQAGKRYGKAVIPGVMTPTEMMQAVEQGADMVKVYPAETLGPNYLKHLRAPFPHVSVIPTGGIDEENLTSFIRAGAAAVGIGGKLVDKQALETGDYQPITQAAKRYIQLVKQARQGK